MEYLSIWEIQPIDRIFLEEDMQNLGIGDIRLLEKRISLVPLVSPAKCGIVRNAERLTTQAQHAILKTLEEPPLHTYIILETQNPQQLLSTIISRCHMISLRDNNEVRANNYANLIQLENILGSSVGMRLKVGEQYGKSRTEAQSWLEAIIYDSRHKLIQLSKTDYASQHKYIRKLTNITRAALTALGQLKANVNPRLTIDIFILTPTDTDKVMNEQIVDNQISIL